jgi:Zn-finger protein
MRAYYERQICSECGCPFCPDTSLHYTYDEDENEWLCEDCTKVYNMLAGKMLVKAFEVMPTMYRKALSDTRLPGIEELYEKLEEEYDN